MLSSLEAILRDQLATIDTQWSVGSFGAIAEFSRDSDEPAVTSGLSAVTNRGGVRIVPVENLRLFASESVTRDSWSQRVSLCLPGDHAKMAERRVLTELGPDAEALRPEDRDAVLFDLGLGTYQVDACVRVPDAAAAARLREVAGRNVFEAGNPAMQIILSANPHRVFISRIGRAEVFQPIPPPDGRSPEGPHTHVLPKLLQHGRTHAATEPIPEGHVPCAHFYPAHPAKDALGRRRPFHAPSHSAFRTLLESFGDRGAIELKRAVAAAIARGAAPSELDAPDDRFGRANVRIAVRQIEAAEPGSPLLAAWTQRFDKSHPVEIDDMESLHQHA